MAKAIYVWDGAQFVPANVPVAAVPDSVVAYSSASPVNAQVGQVWNDVASGTLRVWSGSTWISYAPINNPTFTGTVSASAINTTGLVTIAESTEFLATGTISANVFTADFSTSGVFYITTAPTANFTINVTNLPTTDNRITVLSFFVIQGATGFIPNALQIGGAAQTIKWSGGSAPTPTSSAGRVDVFTFTFIRRSSTWEVLGTSDTNY